MTDYARRCRIGRLVIGLFTLLGPLAVAATAQPAGPSDGQARRPAPQFTDKPQVRNPGAPGDQYVITFACKSACDVTVSIVDGDGRIVRHLAAGVLGSNAPAPFAKDSLAQRILWDGKDDDGKAISDPGAAGDQAKGPLAVRVDLGLGATYDGLAFADPEKTGPNRLEGIAGLAVSTSRDGRVYVMDRWSGLAWWSTQKIHVFGRDGAYEKTIKPFPPSLPAERVKAIGAFVNSFGSINPLIYRAEGTAFYSQEEVIQQPVVTPQGQIVMATRSNVSAYSSARSHLAVIDTDGGVPEGGFDGPDLKATWADNPCLTLAPDGKTLYVVGVRPAGSRQPAHAVYSTRLPERGPLEAVFGDPVQAGDDNAHLSGPRSVAVDGRGRLLVADFANNRVVVVDGKTRAFVASFPAKAPSWVGVDRGTGAAYVCSEQTQVIKFTGFDRDPLAGVTEQSRADLSGLLSGLTQRYRERAVLHFALDCSARPATLWAGYGAKLVRCRDEGARFAEPQPADCTAAEFFWRPTADPTRRLVACRVGVSGSSLLVLDEATGRVRRFGSELAGQEGRTHRLGRDGSIFAVDHALGVIRYDAEGKRRPFEATANDGYLKGRLPAGQTGTTMWERDFWVDRKGDIYVRQNGTVYHGTMTVQVYDSQGHYKRTVLWEVSDGMFGPKVDAQGNLYILEIVKPQGRPYPEEFKDRIAGPGQRGYGGMHWYDWIYGSIVKFSPAGGAVWFKSGRLGASSAVSFEGWRAWSPVRDDIVFVAGDANSVTDLRTAGGSLAGTIRKSPVTLALPWPCTIDTAAIKTITMRLKNDSDGTRARLGYHLVGERYATPSSTQTIPVRPNSDFTEYTFDLSAEKDWKGHVFGLTLSPTDGAKGAFHIDWVRVGEPGQAGGMRWDFNAEETEESKLPASMKKELVAAFSSPQGAELQGALWMQPGFGHVGQCYDNDHCHCAGTDFDVDDYGRVFAPDTGRFRVGVLDTNGNPIVSFGGYGNQDCRGTDSYVLDPQTRRPRARKADDPADLVSPFARPQVAFGWIIGVAVTDRYAYVADLINKRVLRVRLDYAASESCPLP